MTPEVFDLSHLFSFSWFASAKMTLDTLCYLPLPVAVSLHGPTFPQGSEGTPADRQGVLAPLGALASYWLDV
jgi:hypothetical protein